MTSSDLRIVMAELDGKLTQENWSHINSYAKGKWWLEDDGFYFMNGGNTDRLQKIPNYPFDLNAVHELEKKLTNEQSIKYIDILGDAVNKGFGYGSYGEIFNLLTATALQRCEALARLHGKWKD